MFIRTERLFLRPAWPEDLDELTETLGGDAVIPSIGVSALPRTTGELREYLARPRDGLLPHFFINLRAEGGARLIGSIGLGRAEQDVELGFAIGRRYRGHGYAAEAVRAVLAEARMLGHRRIVAAHFPDGEPSARVLRQAGFKPTAETRSRYSTGRRGEAPARLYVAVLADKLFDMLGVGPQRAAA